MKKDGTFAPEFYELLEEYEHRLDEVLDINGWDIKKALRQFARGNATSTAGIFAGRYGAL